MFWCRSLKLPLSVWGWGPLGRYLPLYIVTMIASICLATWFCWMEQFRSWGGQPLQKNVLECFGKKLDLWYYLDGFWSYMKLSDQFSCVEMRLLKSNFSRRSVVGWFRFWSQGLHFAWPARDQCAFCAHCGPARASGFGRGRVSGGEERTAHGHVTRQTGATQLRSWPEDASVTLVPFFLIQVNSQKDRKLVMLNWWNKVEPNLYLGFGTWLWKDGV